MFNLGLDRGSYYPLTVQVNVSAVPLDLTGYTNPVMTINAQTLAGLTLLDTVTGTFNASAGQVLFDLSSTRTAAYAWREAVYKVEVTDTANQVRRLIQGVITVNN